MRLWASIKTRRPRFPFATFGFYGPHSRHPSSNQGVARSPRGRMVPRMKNLIEVSVDSIRIHMPTSQHLVILKEKEADRYLPIWIGSFEAQAIATKISGNPLGRPLTHDLMATAFGDLDFDARPSDAIALAVRMECPIFVATEVMEAAGIIPEADESSDDKEKTE